ncbi:Uncharacterised protein [Bordetella pertussis]|nr:Uncharacterised protein [Bordetella pertussis]CFW32303.1 Uncharacterised protein [Bordetella pertussis]
MPYGGARWKPTCTFSSADISPNSSVFWKVRHTPRRQMRCGGRRSSCPPCRRTAPEVGR